MEHDKEMNENLSVDHILSAYQNASLKDMVSDYLFSYLGTKKPIAFQELFIPVIRLARKYFWGRFSSFPYNNEVPDNSSIFSNAFPFLSEKAYFSLEYCLLELLSLIASKVLEMEFSLYRTRYQTALDRLLCSSTSTKLYNSFIQTMYEGDFIGLLEEYPEMARLFAVVTQQWLDATNELLDRLKWDMNDVAHTFNNDMALGCVIDIECGISDRHNGGQTVVILTFCSGFKLVYKPRSLGMEEAWFNLLFHLNNELSLDMFKYIKVLNRDSYGWMEYVEHLPCKEESEIKQYYHRAGALLCTVHILKGTDCHHQNLIVCGSYPVLIDLETLFHPYTRELNTDNSTYSDEEIEKYHSVLRTGLLPSQTYKQDGKTFDLSGLGGGIGGYPMKLEWVDINSDNMRQEYIDRECSTPSNLPYLHGKVLTASCYVNEFVIGFEEIYRYFLRKKCTTEISEFLLPFTSLKSRLVIRSTTYYFSAISKYTEPKILKTGIDTNILKQLLGKSNLPTTDTSFTASLLKKELEALNVVDIPYFHISICKSESVMNEDCSVGTKFSKPGLEIVKDYILLMNEDDLSKQVKMIRIALKPENIA